ncbi:MAG: stilbene synthase [Planctomycetes bacterium]|nr:stilbene synthase [Planctomycetota bacterium]
MFLTGIGTALPPRRFTQAEVLEAFTASDGFASLAPRSRSLLRRILASDNGLATRHFAVDTLAEAFELTPDALHARFARAAPELATAAAGRALARAHLRPHDIDGLVVSTCTGSLCPGLTSYVGERLGLRPDAACVDLVGQGCGAALPNLRTAAAYVRGDGARHVLSVCVEVCSAALYLDDDAGVIVSACLFGDGAGAAVVSARPLDDARPVRWRHGATLLRPDLRDELRFEARGGMLRNILRPTVPELAAEAAEQVLAEGLLSSGRSRADVAAWIWHAGGASVLASLRARLDLSERDVAHSADVLREHGNVSSPCVFFVLERALASGAPDGAWWMSSFGAGFACHGAWLEVG